MSTKKKKYWFKIIFGKWEDEEFDPEITFVYVEAWDAFHAIKKAKKQIGEDDEVITNVIYVGYTQI